MGGKTREEILERVREIRFREKMTQTEFGERLKISQKTVSAIEKGVANLTERNIDAICKEFGIRREWLETGEGDMKVLHDGSVLELLAKEYNLTPKERVLIENFLKLNERQREFVLTAVENAAKMAEMLGVTSTATKKRTQQNDYATREDFLKDLDVKLDTVPDNKKTREQKHVTLDVELDAEEAAKKEATSMSSASTGLSGASSKNLIDSS